MTKQCVALAVFLCAGSAVSAQFSAAGGARPGSGQGSQSRIDEYMVDDGSYEDGIGLTAGGGIAFANGYTSIAGRDLITAVRIAFGVPSSLNGMPVTAYLWSDPNGDGNPSDAQVLAQAAGVISGAVEIANLPNNSPTFVEFNIPDTIVPIGQKFFVGYVIQNQQAGQYPGAIDVTSNAGVSYTGYVVGGSFDPNAWTNVFSTGDIGFPGNWMLRANATGSNPNAVGACCFSNGSCSFITLGNCLAQNGNFAGETVLCANAHCPQPGACCLDNGTCQFIQQTACVSAGGVFNAGMTCAQANCPQPGACCFFDGSCQMLVPVECVAAGGSAQAGNCGSVTCPGFVFTTAFPGTFTDIANTGTLLVQGDDATAAFTSSATNAAMPLSALFASTNGVISQNSFGNFGNTALPAVGAGRALFPFWDDLYADPATNNGSVLIQSVVENGVNVQIVQWNNVRTFGGGTGSATGTFQCKIFASGPVYAQYIYPNVTFAGNGNSATVGVQGNDQPGQNVQFSFNQGVITNGMVLSLAPTGGSLGACCLPNGSCVANTSAGCTSSGGVYQGNGTSCGTTVCPPPAGVWVEVGEAGDLPGTANVTTGSGALNEIRGNIGTGDADMYQFRICSPTSFSATTVGGTSIDTQLFLFNANGNGVAFDDDDPQGATLQSRLTSAFTSSLPAGVFNLAVSTYDRDATSGGQEIWIDTPFNVERAPDGPGAAGAVNAWSGSGATGAYTVFLTGSCYSQAGGGCYANCDNSTTPPVLNVADFTCFLQRYAAGQSYANCDLSTQPPVLNVADFTCFLQRYAAGCP